MNLRVRFFTAIVMISLMFPATVEVFENVVHLTLHGYTTILDATVQHHHTTDTECCGSPSPHFSGLNFAQLFHSSTREPVLFPPLTGRTADAIAEEKTPCDGFGTILFRPPIA